MYTSPPDENGNPGKSYIGQSIQPPHIRFSEHKRSAEAYKNGKKSKGCLAFWNAINLYGIENMHYEILLWCSDDSDELDAYEIQFIKQYNTIRPNGYNIKSGGKCGKLTEESKAKIGKSTVERAKAKGILLKYVHISENLPMYISPYGDMLGYRIQNHPKCKSKCFSLKVYGSLENAKIAALDYYNKLNSNEIIHENKPLPNYIKKFDGNGFYVSKTIKRHEYYKVFNTKSLDENKSDAESYLNMIDNDPINKTDPIVNGETIPVGMKELMHNNGFYVRIYKKSSAKPLTKSFTKHNTRLENYNDAILWYNSNKN
jgi:hypothetical protein